MIRRLFARFARVEKVEAVSVGLPVVPALTVTCEAAPGDTVTAERTSGVGSPARVVVRMTVGGSSAHVVLSPAKARQYAAALLNQADGIDGYTSMFTAEGGQ